MFFARLVLVFMVALWLPISSFAVGTDENINNAERTIALVMRGCLSSSKFKFKISGEVDLSILKILKGGGKVSGKGEFDQEDIISYLPGLKDELQQSERDAIRKCVNPMMHEILEHNGLLPKKKVNKVSMTSSDLSQVRPSLQIDEEDKEGLFSSEYIAYYTLMVSNPFQNSDILCSVSVKSFYFIDMPSGNRSVKTVSRKIHDNILIEAGKSESVGGEIKFIDKGSLGSRMWVETNKWLDGRQLDFPGGVRLENCVFVE